MVDCAAGTAVSPRRSHRVLGLLPAILLVAACGTGAATPTAVPATATPAPTAPPTPTLTPTLPPTAAPTVAASPTVDPFALASMFTGTYSGTWRNTTFGSTGSAALEIGLDRPARTMSVKVTLGGNVFGSPPPAPETLTAPLGTSGGLTATSTTFGPITVTAVPEGLGVKVTISAPNVPSTRIATFTATGTITSPTMLQLAYTVTFRSGSSPAQGTVTLNKT